MPEFLVLGGDAAAAHHARQLGAASGRPPRRVVDANCEEAIREWLPRAAPDDHLVPAPTMPHLLGRWLAAELEAAPAETPLGWGLPFEIAAPRASYSGFVITPQGSRPYLRQSPGRPPNSFAPAAGGDQLPLPRGGPSLAGAGTG